MPIAFWAPLLRPGKVAAQYLSRWPLPSSVLQSQLGLSSGVAILPTASGLQYPQVPFLLTIFWPQVGSCVFPQG